MKKLFNTLTKIKKNVHISTQSTQINLKSVSQSVAVILLYCKWALSPTSIIARNFKGTDGEKNIICAILIYKFHIITIDIKYNKYLLFQCTCIHILFFLNSIQLGRYIFYNFLTTKLDPMYTHFSVAKCIYFLFTYTIFVNCSIRLLIKLMFYVNKQPYQFYITYLHKLHRQNKD